jgi:predicted metal-dependent peptidase
MQAERRLQKAVITLIRHPLFADMSGILMLGSKTVRDDVPSAATDGRDEVYGRAFVDMIPDKELNFVVVHEGKHKQLRHLTTWEKLWKEDPRLANMAMDYYVNLDIVETDPGETVVAMPKINGKAIGLLDRRFKGLNTKQIFDILKQEQQEAGGGGGGGGFDEHDWEGAKQLTEEEKQELAKEIEQAIRQGQMAAERMHGKSGKHRGRELMDVLDPKVDWRTLLREFVTSTCSGRDESTWRRPNRRYMAHDIILPSMISERVSCVAVGCDTSGSITDADHARNLSEAQAVFETVRPEKVHVIYWDHTVAAHEEYGEAQMDTFRQSTKPKGGGGTDPSCMERYLKKKDIKPDCIIMFTDGYVPNWGNDWGGVPVLWCITGGNRAVATTGKTIHIEE